MDVARRVRVRESREELPPDPGCRRRAGAASRSHPVQGVLAVHVFHDELEMAVDLEEVVELDDAGVALAAGHQQAAEGLDLAVEVVDGLVAGGAVGSIILIATRGCGRAAWRDRPRPCPLRRSAPRSGNRGWFPGTAAAGPRNSRRASGKRRPPETSQRRQRACATKSYARKIRRTFASSSMPQPAQRRRRLARLLTPPSRERRRCCHPPRSCRPRGARPAPRGARSPWFRSCCPGRGERTLGLGQRSIWKCSRERARSWFIVKAARDDRPTTYRPLSSIRYSWPW